MKNLDVLYAEKYADGMSLKQIAEQFNTYPNKIRRSLLKNGTKLRDKSEAQVNALEQGTSVHPTKGRKRTEKEKSAIANSVSNSWTDDRKAEMSEVQKENWENLSQATKDKFFSLAAKANRKAAEDGSKLEKFIFDGLIKEGHKTEFHKESLIENRKMHMDLFLPKLNTVIEIDGPSHFLPIWGEEALRKKIQSDTLKNGLLMKSGFKIIRVKNMKKNLSKLQMQRILTNIQTSIQSIENGTNKKLIEIEVK